ncbi:MAG: tryptophan synthase subunit alpha [Cytophagia bacterium]|nr:tryptophan synthase subunit alpha [Cytophagia bacterium]|tara:strand:+ start:28 stop:795 length:768 start_codon:yes stop_codon:yes gene_type:complete
MNRINKLFKEKKNKILSIYFTAGYPNLNDTIEILKTLDECGVDLIEIGMPFSDPIADGPVIQDSSNVAIDNGMNLNILFKQLEEIRDITDIPIVLMGYVNPVYQFGYEKFIKNILECDLDGLILPDLPLDDYINEFKPVFDKENLSFIPLITPNTSEERIRQIDNNSNGFIYMVSSSSTTGKKSTFDNKQIDYFKKIRSLSLKNPTVIGFGISDKESFMQACKYSNGAIIGSKFIQSLSKSNIKKSIRSFVYSIR